MKFTMKKRRSIRLQDYDYAQAGAYFVTICTHERHCLFGNILHDEMHLNETGSIVLNEWEQTAVLRPYLELDAFVIMPNHFHGIVVIIENDNAVGARCIAPLQLRQFGPLTPKSLSTIVGTFKAAVTWQINRGNENPIHVWQRNYYEHVIRNELDLDRIRAYIQTNPVRWREDSLFV